MTPVVTKPRVYRLSGGEEESDRAFHERNAKLSETDPEAALAELDARYHDHLPEGANCRLCGVEHAAINPEVL